MRLDPHNARAFYNRGHAHHDRGELDRAIADFDAALRLDPHNAQAYNSRGHAHALRGEDDRAFADYAAALRLDPDLAKAYSQPRRPPGPARRAGAGRGRSPHGPAALGATRHETRDTRHETRARAGVGCKDGPETAGEVGWSRCRCPRYAGPDASRADRDLPRVSCLVSRVS